MSRPVRVEFPGAIYHVLSHGVDGAPTFADDLDCRTATTSSTARATSTSIRSRRISAPCPTITPGRVICDIWDRTSASTGSMVQNA
jgi:hypothetical protein